MIGHTVNPVAIPGSDAKSCGQRTTTPSNGPANVPCHVSGSETFVGSASAIAASTGMSPTHLRLSKTEAPKYVRSIFTLTACLDRWSWRRLLERGAESSGTVPLLLPKTQWVTPSQAMRTESVITRPRGRCLQQPAQDRVSPPRGLLMGRLTILGRQRQFDSSLRQQELTPSYIG